MAVAPFRARLLIYLHATVLIQTALEGLVINSFAPVRAASGSLDGRLQDPGRLRILDEHLERGRHTKYEYATSEVVQKKNLCSKSQSKMLHAGITFF